MYTSSYIYDQQISFKIEWTSINEKRNVTEVDRSKDSNLGQSPLKKWTNLYKYSNFLPGF